MINYLLDDVDTVKLIASFNKYLNNFDNYSQEEKIQILSLIKYIDDKILKLDLFKEKEENEIEIPKEIEELAKKRWEAKKERNWELADKLRDELLEKGRKILDKKD
jgi:cysteinyl-tRNA synthetase